MTATTVKGGNSAGPGDFAADTIGGALYPHSKLFIGDASTATRVDSSNPLPAYLASALPAGTNLIGAVTPRFGRVAVTATPTVSTSPAYTAGDAVGGLMTFANAARTSGATILIEAVVVIDKSKQAPALVLQLFDRSVTVASDNAAADYSDSDALFGLPPIQLSNWETYGSNSICGRVVNLPWKMNATDLYGQFVTRGTPTFAGTSDIVVLLICAQD